MMAPSSLPNAASARQILMCAPTYFEVAYVINPWMQQGQVNPASARAQWQRLHDSLAEHVEVLTIEPQPGLPDMVFTANAGIVIGGRAMLSHFLPPERRGEQPYFAKWFKERCSRLLELPVDVYFEGAGDCLLDPVRDILWTGLGPRFEPRAGSYLTRAYEREVVLLKLIDPRFYHLDTCFCPLSAGHVMYYPGAFDAAGRTEIERRVPVASRLAVSGTDAEQMACNAINIGRHVFLHRASPALTRALHGAGYRVHAVELGEFLKAGGSAKCLTLLIDSEHPVKV